VLRAEVIAGGDPVEPQLPLAALQQHEVKVGEGSIEALDGLGRDIKVQQEVTSSRANG